MKCSIESLLHCGWPTDPDLLDIIKFESVELLVNELLVPSTWVLAILSESSEQFKVLLAFSVAVIEESFTELESN